MCCLPLSYTCGVLHLSLNYGCLDELDSPSLVWKQVNKQLSRKLNALLKASSVLWKVSMDVSVRCSRFRVCVLSESETLGPFFWWNVHYTASALGLPCAILYHPYLFFPPPPPHSPGPNVGEFEVPELGYISPAPVWPVKLVLATLSVPATWEPWGLRPMIRPLDVRLACFKWNYI